MRKSNKTKVGRPKLGRTEAIVVTVTPEEYGELMVTAAKQGLRLPIYVRTVLGLGE